MNVNIYVFILFFTFVVSCLIATLILKKSLVQIKQEFQMQIQPDISLEQMKRLEKKIDDFKRERNLASNASIFDVADALNVKDNGAATYLSGRARISPPNANNTKFVVHNREIPRSEWLFDFAHECGHLINGDSIPAERPEGHHKSEIEQLADYTGAAILMPLEAVYSFLTQNNYLSSSRHNKNIIINKLSRQYKMDSIIVIRRIKEVYMIKGVS